MAKNIHASVFDAGTIEKLEIFQEYAKAWLPVFLYTDAVKELYIFDFFAGSGSDVSGVAGSPVRIIKEINKFYADIFTTKTKVKLILNEFDPKKYKDLEEEVNGLPSSQMINEGLLEIHLFNNDFQELFIKYNSIMSNNPSLLLLDQNGVKHISNDVFKKAISYKYCDFLFFVSSSYVRRFTEKFSGFFPGISLQKIKSTPFPQIHYEICKYYRGLIPSGNNTRLFAYTIEKNGGYYGLVFGADHPLALEKYLIISWKKDPINGMANFDVLEDKGRDQFLFADMQLTRIDKFKNKLKEKLKNGSLKNNLEVYWYSLEKGFLPSHARTALSEMKKKKIIYYEGKTAKISYAYYRNNEIVNYKVL